MSTRDIAKGSERRTDRTDNEECPECAGHLDTERGEISCTECGLVVTEDWLDYRGRRTFSGGGFTRERTGAPLTAARHDRGLSTVIGIGRDANGNALNGRKRRQLRRLRTHHSRARFRSKAERNLAHGLGEIDRLRGYLELPRSLRDRACSLFRRAQAENLLVGRSIEGMAAGCVYAAGREFGYLRTVEEVVAASSCPESTVRNAYQVLGTELGVRAPPPSADAYLARIASGSNASEKVRERAAALVRIAEAAGIANGRNPAGVAAACLYVAGQDVGSMLTQSALGDVAGVTPTTIRARVGELREAGV